MKEQINRPAGESVKKAPKFFNIVEKIKNFREQETSLDLDLKRKEFFEFFSDPKNLVHVPKDFKFNREEANSEMM